MTRPSDVLDFWFAEGRDAQWFGGGPAFDDLVRQALTPAYTAARKGACDDWREMPEGCVALCILLDQYPRNVFRGTARAFADDPDALAVTRHALKRGFDAQLGQRERMFLYLPLEHSEVLADQDDCVRLFAGLDQQPDWLHYAEAHRDIIARFGRFPHRNEILGRDCTPEEEAFLKEPNSSF